MMTRGERIGADEALHWGLVARVVAAESLEPALQEFIARRRQKQLLDLMGKLEWDSSYDYKAERTRD